MCSQSRPWFSVGTGFGPLGPSLMPWIGLFLHHCGLYLQIWVLQYLASWFHVDSSSVQTSPRSLGHGQICFPFPIVEIGFAVCPPWCQSQIHWYRPRLHLISVVCHLCSSGLRYRLLMVGSSCTLRCIAAHLLQNSFRLRDTQFSPHWSVGM